MLQRTDESVRCVSVSQRVETISAGHSLGLDSRKHWRAAAALFHAQAKTDAKSDSRLVKHRHAVAAQRKLSLVSQIKHAFLVDTNNYDWAHATWSRSGLAN